MVLLLPAQVSAITAIADDTVIISENINEDVYSAGRKVLTNNRIGGDLIVAGQTLDILSPVEGDLVAAGQMLDVVGEIGDDIRIAGQKITIGASVGDSVTAFGQDIIVKKGSQIKGDFWAFGETVVINEKIGGNVLIEADQVILNAIIEGNASIKAAKGIQMGEKGQIDGDLKLSAVKNVEADKVGGDIKFTPFAVKAIGDLKNIDKDIVKVIVGFIAGIVFLKFLGMIAIAALIIWMLKNYILNFVKTGKKDWLQNAGIGFAVLILAPVLAVLLLVSFIGAPFGGLVILAYISAMIVTKLVVGFFVGHLILPVNARSSFARMLGSFTLGLLVFMILTLVPVLGWIVQFIIFLIALGGICRLELDFFKTLRKAKKI